MGVKQYMWKCLNCGEVNLYYAKTVKPRKGCKKCGKRTLLCVDPALSEKPPAVESVKEKTEEKVQVVKVPVHVEDNRQDKENEEDEEDEEDIFGW